MTADNAFYHDTRAFAESVRDAHDPTMQVGNDYKERCELCSFTRHPCDPYDMADTVLHLLDLAYYNAGQGNMRLWRVRAEECAEQLMQTHVTHMFETSSLVSQLQEALKEDPDPPRYM